MGTVSDQTAVSDKSVSNQTVSNQTVSESMSNKTAVHKGSSVDSMDKGSGVVDSVDGVDGGSRGVSSSRGRGVLGLSGVGHLSNVAGQVVGVVGDGLDPAVGEVDRVRSGYSAGAIVGLGLLEGSLGVVISNSVGVCVGGGLGQVSGRVACSVDHGVGHSVLGGGAGGGRKGESDEGLVRNCSSLNTFTFTASLPA